MTEIAEVSADGRRPVDFFRDTLRLRWAYEGESPERHKGIDLPKGIKIHFDVLSTKLETKDGNTQAHSYLQIADQGLRYDPDRLKDKIQFGKQYHFTILVVAEGALPKRVDLKVRLGAVHWNEIEVIQ